MPWHIMVIATRAEAENKFKLSLTSHSAPIDGKSEASFKPWDIRKWSQNTSQWLPNMAAMVRLSVRHFSCARGPALLSNQNAFESKSVYPAILPSTTAKSRSAKQRRVAEFFDQLRGSNVKDKLSSLTKLQRMKYVVYPQTFALNADKWYQHFTKTAYISELPEKYSMSAHETEKSNTLPQIDAAALAEIRTLVCNSLLQENCQVRKGRAPLLKELQYTVAPFLKNLSSGMTCVLAKQNPLLRSSTFGKVNVDWACVFWVQLLICSYYPTSNCDPAIHNTFS